MGGDVSKGIDTATSIITGIITGDITGGLAGASAPWIAEQIKLHTGHMDKDGNWVSDNETARLVSHAILGAVVAELQGNSGLAGGAGAVGGELAAKVILDNLYGGKDIKDLTEAEKQNISALTQLVMGLSTAVSGGDAGDISTSIAASKNAVENNYFGQAIVNAAKSQCDGNKDCEDKIIKEGIDSYNETIIEYGTPQVIAIGAVIAAPIAEPAVVACSANPVLCANQVAAWLIETVGFEGNPAMGLGMTAGVYVNSLSKAELNELAAIMTLEKNKLIKNSSPLIDELKVTLSEDSAHKLVYDKATNSIIKQAKAGKGISNISTLNPSEIRFSQNTVSYNKVERGTDMKYTYDDLVTSMKTNGWKGEPVNVIKMPDGKYTSMDNTRIAAAREAGIDIKANIRNFDDKLSPSEVNRFSDPKKGFIPTTWGEAITGRINKQSGGFSKNNPYGSSTPPRISGKPKD
ncbi:VENN motif pre-toxin domain-containing protein [Gilliamella sp. Bif1-4]|uniref:VENN motif pre-toxin domain-containing protein n=1 Tax=Gilliamella sp. Bif1-4 TaxID=3120233 RepID=UPI00080E6D47|nr:VENN motif pre-toxin domain-containing protein [Gilliamella apicola]OCG42893.1 hypothetical protein A9G25_00760 [Gilliamella apicola]